MRWDGGGDDGADDGDGVDDYPDDARRDGDDDGSDSPHREGNSPADFSLPELFFSLSVFRLVEAAEKINPRRGAGEGPQGWARGCWPPLLPGARLCATFWLRDLFPKIIIPEIFWNFWGFRSQVS